MSAASRLAAWRRWIFGEEGGAGLVLTGGGVGVSPTWETPGSGGGPAAQLDADGTTLSVNAIADGNLLRRTSATVVGATCTAAGYALLDDATAADQRVTLELGTAATTDASAYEAAGAVAAHASAGDPHPGYALESALAAVATSGSASDLGSGTVAVARLPVMTASVAGIVPTPPNNTTDFLRGDGTYAVPPGSGGAPSWASVVIGAYGRTDPQDLIDMATTNGVVAATPTAITASVARIAYFRPQANISVQRIRWRGVGTVASIYHVAVYNGDTLARVSSDHTISTTAATWGSVASSFSLTSGQLYFVAVSASTTGTTAGLLCFSPTVAATTGLLGSLPRSAWPGNLVLTAGHLAGGLAQFAVTAGALPTTAPTIAAQAAWTGGMPAFWLDSSAAA